jgi:hypothetical protein
MTRVCSVRAKLACFAGVLVLSLACSVAQASAAAPVDGQYFSAEPGSFVSFMTVKEGVLFEASAWGVESGTAIACSVPGWEDLAFTLQDVNGTAIHVPLEVGKPFKIKMPFSGTEGQYINTTPVEGEFEIAGTVPNNHELAGTLSVHFVINEEVTCSGKTTFKVANELETPEIEQVDFKKNVEVEVDHPVIEGVVGTKPFKITDFHGPGETGDEIEWKRNLEKQEVTKDWPVAYVNGEPAIVDAHLQLNDLPGPLTIRGETNSIFGTALHFEKTITQREAAEHAFEPISTGDMTSKPNLPKTDGYVGMEIKWTVEVAGEPIDAGTSTHNLFLLSKKPVAGTAPVAFTVLDLDADGTDGDENSGVKESMEGVWHEFEAPAPGVAPMTYARDYDPADGEITVADEPLHYYSEIKPTHRNLKELLEAHADGQVCQNTTAQLLLETGEGQCGAWAELLRYALGAEGILSQHVTLWPHFHEAGDLGGLCDLAPCLLLIDKWGFIGAGQFATRFPYSWTEEFDEEGLPGQAVNNPPPYFGNHQIVRVLGGTDEGNPEVLYDPSYGVGPIVGTGTGAGLASAGAKQALKTYQTNAIAGFCGRVRRNTGPKTFVEEYVCQKNPAGDPSEPLKLDTFARTNYRH